MPLAKFTTPRSDTAWRKLLRQVFAVSTTDFDYVAHFETHEKEASADEETAVAEAPTQEKVVGHSQAQSPSRKVVTTTASIVVENRPAINFAASSLDDTDHGGATFDWLSSLRQQPSSDTARRMSIARINE